MKRAWRWLKRLTIGLVALVLVVVAAALIVLHTDWGRRLVRDQVVAALGKTFPGGISIGRIDGSPFGTLVIEDIALNGPDKLPLVRIARVEVEVSLQPLLAKQVWVDRIEASGVVVTNPRPPAPPDDEPSEPSPWTIDLPRVIVRDAALHIPAQPGGEAIDLVDIAAQVGLSIAPISGDMSVLATLRATWQQRSAPIAGLASAVIGEDIHVPFVALSAAGANVVVAGGQVNAPAGQVIATLPRKAARTLVPGLELPGGITLALAASTRDSASTADLTARMGRSRLHGRIVGNVAELSAHGVLAASYIDLARLSQGAATGDGAALLAFDVSALHGVRGTLLASTGRVTAPAVTRRRRPRERAAPALTVPSIDTLVAFAAQPTAARALVLTSAAGRARVAVVGGAQLADDKIVVEPTYVGAAVPELYKALGGIAPVRGAVELALRAQGTVGDKLTADGWFTGKSIRADALGIARADGRFDLRLGRSLAGGATLSAVGITNAGSPIGKATVIARSRPDQRFDVSVDAAPAMAPVLAHLEAVAALPTAEGLIAIDLGAHRVQLPDGAWVGNGGRVRIDTKQIAVSEFASASGDARLAANVTIGRTTDVIRGAVKLTDADLHRLDPQVRGLVDVDVSVEKRGIRWKGGGSVKVTGLAGATPDALPLDGAVELAVDGRRVDVGVRVSSKTIGGVRVALAVDGPRDLTDADAWKRVARSDLHGVTVGLDSIQGAAASDGAVSGVFDGTIEIREGVPDGKLRVRGVSTPLGTASADVAVALDADGYLDITGEGAVGDAGTATFGARVQIPDRPFDVEVYKRVGKDLIQGATLETSEIHASPALFDKLGFITPYSGYVTARVDVGAGGSSIETSVDVRRVTGGPLRAPVDVHAGASVDGKETTAELRVTSRAGTLLELVDARTPVSLAQWLAAAAQKPFALPAAPIAGTLSVPTIEAKQALALFGREDVTSGTIGARVTAGGTLRAPTVQALIELANIAVRPRLAGKPPPTLTALKVEASLDSATAKLRITGEEAGAKPSDTGSLLVDASTDPKNPAALVGAVKIKNFDLTPVAVFLPGMLVGAQGKLETDLALRVDPKAGNVRGNIAISELRLPFSPLFAPLRKGTLSIVFGDTIDARLEGVVGAEKSTVLVLASADALGKDMTLSAKIAELTPIGFLQPKISARIEGTLHREKLYWTGKLGIKQGLVFIPEARGNDLLDDYAPGDLLFVGQEEVDLETLRLRPPVKPFAVIDIDIATTRIELPSFVIPTLVNVPIVERGKATAAGRVRMSIGDTIGMDGEILVDRGEATIFGRKYDIELGQVGFDGTIDPLFDIKLAHEFPEVTTFVRFAGRLSQIDTLDPEFSADPGTYSESELFGFFLGGTPGATSGQANQDAISAAGQVAASNVIGAFLRQKLTRGKIDVLRCDPETSTRGRSCVAGKFFGKREQGFIGGLVRLAPRLDENQTEGRLEYRFRNNVQFELFGGDRAIFGLDFLKRLRF